MVGAILFKKICTTAPCRQGRAPAGGIAHHRAERGRDVGRAPVSSTWLQVSELLKENKLSLSGSEFVLRLHRGTLFNVGLTL